MFDTSDPAMILALCTAIHRLAAARDEHEQAEREQYVALARVNISKEAMRQAESEYHRAQVDLERAVIGTSVSFCAACRSMRCQCPVHAG